MRAKQGIYAFFLLSIVVQGLFAQAWLNEISFRNKTGNTLYYLFFSPGDSEYWGPDVLGSATTFEPGEERTFYVSYPDESALFDFMAIDSEGNVYEEFELEISDGEAKRLIIHPELITDSLDLAAFEEELIALQIANETGFEIYYLFVSPSDSDMYGIDFMDSETTLQSGELIEVLMIRPEEEFFFDVMGVDSEDDSYSFQLELDSELDVQYVEIEIEDLD